MSLPSNISTELAPEEENTFACEGYEPGKYVWAVFSALCFAVGFPASVAILWDMARRSSLTPNDFFILNLSVMDAVFLTFIPAGILNEYLWRDWYFGCFWNGIYALSTCGRPLLMACTCLDCYVAVVHPVVYHQRRSLAPRAAVAAVVWTLTVALAITYGLYYQLFFSPMPSMGYTLSIFIIVICDGLILRALPKLDPGRRNIHPQKQRAVQILTSSLVMAVLSYVPPVFLLIIFRCLIDSFQVFKCSVVFPVTITSTLGSAVMPLLSLYNVGKLDCFRISRSDL